MATMITTNSSRYATAKARYGRNRRSRNSAHSPASQTGAAHRPGQHELQDDERDRVARTRVLLAQRPAHRQRRPAVVRLPEQVGHPQQDGDAGASQRYGLPSTLQRRSTTKPGEQRDDEEQDRVLGVERDADDEADEEPQALVAGAQDAQHEQHDQRPAEQVVDRRTGEVRDDQERRDGEEERRERLGEAAAAQLAGRQAGEHHGRRESQRREQAEAEERVTEQASREPHERDAQRRLVHVAPRQVLGRGDEIELVAVVAVTAGDEHEDDSAPAATPITGSHATGARPRGQPSSRLSCSRVAMTASYSRRRSRDSGIHCGGRGGRRGRGGTRAVRRGDPGQSQSGLTADVAGGGPELCVKAPVGRCEERERRSRGAGGARQGRPRAALGRQGGGEPAAP